MLLVRLLPLVVALRCSGCSGSTEPASPGAAGPGPLVAAGWTAFEGGDFAGALSRFEQALAVDAAATAAQTGRGWSLARLGRYDQALSALRSAASSDGDDLDAQAGRGLVAAVRDRHLEAIDAATRVLVASPHYVFAHDARVDARQLRLTRAQLYYRSVRFAEAAADLDLLEPEAAPHATDPHELLEQLAALSGAVEP